MQLISKFNKGFRFLLCVVDIFSKYAWVVSLKDKNSVSIAFQKILDDSNEKHKDPKFKFGNHVRTSKYKNIFTKGYTPNWLEEASVIKKVRNIVPWTYIISDLNGEEIIGTFYEKEL